MKKLYYMIEPEENMQALDLLNMPRKTYLEKYNDAHDLYMSSSPSEQHCDVSVGLKFSLSKNNADRGSLVGIIMDMDTLSIKEYDVAYTRDSLFNDFYIKGENEEFVFTIIDV